MVQVTFCVLLMLILDEGGYIFCPKKDTFTLVFIRWKVEGPALRTDLDMVKHLKFVLTGN